MKRIILSLWMIIALNSFLVAGGDFKDVEPAIVPFIPIVQEEDRDHLYVGAGIVYNQVYSIDYGFFDDSVKTQDETAGLTGLIGYEFNEYLAVEGRYNKTFWERDYSDTTYYSLFVKPQYKFRDEEKRDDEDGYFSIYGLLGFGNSQVKGSSGDNDHTAWPEDIGRTMMDETGFQWGLGFSYTFVDESDDELYSRVDTWSIFADVVIAAKDADITPTKLYDYTPGNPTGADSTYYDKLSLHGLTVGVLYHF